MDKRVEGRAVTTRSGMPVVTQGRSPPVNVINITRRQDGGIVNVEMKRQEGLNQDGNSRHSITAALSSRGAALANAYRQPVYVTDPQSNVISIQSPRRASPNVSTQLRNVDDRLDWSDQHQRLITPPQRMPVYQHAVPRSSVLIEQQHVPPVSSNHVARAVAEQRMLHSRVSTAVLSQHAHASPASDVRMMIPSNVAASTTVPSVPIHTEDTNGGISYWPAQMGHDLSVSSNAAGRVVVDPKSGNIAPQLISRLPGLQYDVIPARSDGPSEAERKVAVMTQQLENEMRLTTSPGSSSQGSSLRQQMTNTFSQYRSPPPYYGPHITANMKMATPSSPVSNCVTAAGGDMDPASKKADDVSVRQIVTLSSSGLADVESQPAVHQGSDLDALTESYGKLALVFNTSYVRRVLT